MSQLRTADGLTLHLETWAPEPGATFDHAPMTVVLVHGYGEHIARYDAVGKALAGAGFTVHGCDLRGHGRSDGRRGHVNRFEEYFLDLEALVDRAKQDGQPLVAVAHSMGGLVLTLFLIRRGRDKAPFQSFALSSPYFALKLEVPKVKVIAGRAFSRYWPTLALATGLKGADVTRDPALARLYDTDPLNNKNATARWFTEASAAQDEVLARAGEVDWPCLVMHGGADRVANPVRTEEVFARFKSADKTLRILPGQFHEIFNEPEADRNATIASLIDWLRAHAEKRAAHG